MKKSSLVTIGLRAKTGRAIAVVLGGTKDAPVVVSKSEFKLTDPKIPETFQPYHEVMDLPWEQGQKAVLTFTRPIEVVARQTFAKMIKELQAQGLTVKGVGVVGSKDRDLARIGNYHIRAHAAEGILFRSVLERAARASGVTSRTFSDRELDGIAASELGVQSAVLKRRLNELGKPLTPPWRTDEKQAAVAAWLLLD
ncbi:MAG: hypothetical protein ACXW3C_02010 [Pyrinomonadaceae bacterium]